MIFFLLLVVHLVSGDRIMTTNNGFIRGTSVPGTKVDAFLGIPYAEPPVGKLRFAKPVPRSLWEDTYLVNELPPSCIQCRVPMFGPDPNSRMSEDCLYLNMWVPEVRSVPRPIMVFIHGGAFMMGASSMKIYNGAVLSDHGDVIVASINYRLGTLGFFSGFIEEADGNMGMYDQVMAIQWIKDNAKHFGGDPDNIVLFGHSAGSFSVSMHMISPLSKHLFKRGILQSGSAFQPMFSTNNELLIMRSLKVAVLLGCAHDADSFKKNPKKVVDCMKSLPVGNFSDAEMILMATSDWLIPRVGNSFLPENPIDLYQKSDFEGKDVLLGTTRNEGSVFVSMASPQLFGQYGEKAESIAFNDALVEEILRSMMVLGDGGSDILGIYLNRVKQDTGYTYLDALSDVYGDFLFNCGAVFQADCQSKKDNPVYLYLFDFRPSTSMLPSWMGVAHGNELSYVFGNPMLKNMTKNEEELAKSMMDAWTAFAKTGNPNIPGGTKWPRYTVADPSYFVFGKSNSVAQGKPANVRCDAWKKVFRYKN